MQSAIESAFSEIEAARRELAVQTTEPNVVPSTTTLSSSGSTRGNGATATLSVTGSPSHQQTLMQQLLATLHEKDQRLHALEEELQRYRRREESLQRILTASIQAADEVQTERDLLQKKEEALAERSQQIVEDRNRLEADQKAFGDKAAAFERSGQAAHTKINKAAGTAPSDQAVIEAASTGYMNFGFAGRQFNANPVRIDWSRMPHLPDFDIDINDKRMRHLRQHDYYKGWLDSMSALDTLQAWSDGTFSWDAVEYLFDSLDPRSPINAGRNVGLLFGWSAVCKNNNMPQRDARLDDRVWDLHQLRPKSEHVAGSGRDFWHGVKWGTDTANGLFDLKIKSGVWSASKDPEQIQYLKEAGAQGRKV